MRCGVRGWTLAMTLWRQKGPIAYHSEEFDFYVSLLVKTQVFDWTARIAKPLSLYLLLNFDSCSFFSPFPMTCPRSPTDFLIFFFYASLFSVTHGTRGFMLPWLRWSSSSKDLAWSLLQVSCQISFIPSHSQRRTWLVT